MIGVFGDVGQHCEVAECPNDVQCFGDRQWIEQIDEAGRIRVADGSPANGLDQIERRSARLVGDDSPSVRPSRRMSSFSVQGGVIGSG